MPKQEQRQVNACLLKQRRHLVVHVLNTEPSHALSTTVAIALKIYKMDEEAIQGILQSDFKEGILALCKSMEHADLTAIVRQGMIKDLCVVRVHSRIYRVSHIAANKLDS